MNERRGNWPYSSPHLISFLFALASLVCMDDSPNARGGGAPGPLSDEDREGFSGSPGTSWSSRIELESAVREWRTGNSDAALDRLRRVFESRRESPLDVRLYLNSHSNDGGELNTTLDRIDVPR